jgi:hypothetical protein
MPQRLVNESVADWLKDHHIDIHSVRRFDVSSSVDDMTMITLEVIVETVKPLPEPKTRYVVIVPEGVDEAEAAAIASKMNGGTATRKIIREVRLDHSEPSAETHTEETMQKVRRGLHLAMELSQTEVTEMINSMQNQGILFRECASRED